MATAIMSAMVRKTLTRASSKKKVKAEDDGAYRGGGGGNGKRRTGQGGPARSSPTKQRQVVAAMDNPQEYSPVPMKPPISILKTGALPSTNSLSSIEADANNPQESSLRGSSSSSRGNPTGNVNFKDELANRSPSSTVSEEQEIIQILANELWDEDIEIVQNSIDRLSELFRRDNSKVGANNISSSLEKNLETAFRNGVGLVLYQIMNRFQDHESLLTDVMGALCFATSHNLDVQVREDLIEYGVLDLCLKAMKKFLQNDSLLRWACCLIGNLMVNHHLTEQIIGRGSLSAVITAMQDHPRSSRVQDNGCFALHVLLCNSNGNGDEVVGRGGLDVVLYAMNNHPNNGRVQLHGCNVLYYLADGSNERRDLIFKSKGWESLSGAVRLHRNNDQVAKAAANAIRVLFPPLYNIDHA